MAVEFPSSESQPTYYPPVSPSSHVATRIDNWLGDQEAEVLGYGSRVAGDAAVDSKGDFLVIVPDVAAFHAANVQGPHLTYGSPRQVGFHRGLNHLGPNYYQGQLEGMPVKVGVLDTDTFAYHASGGFAPDQRHINPATFYLMGRVQKPLLVPFREQSGAPKQQIDAAISQARFLGTALTLERMNAEFSREEFLREYIFLSYRADIYRREGWEKVDTLLNQSRGEYRDMMDPILGQFEDCGWMEQVDEDQFVRNVPQRRMETALLLRQAQACAWGITLKNWTTNGLVEGLEYGIAKWRRRGKIRQELKA